jgi:hypothetical protein
MGIFTKAAMQMTKKMALVFNGQLMVTSIKALIKDDKLYGLQEL